MMLQRRIRHGSIICGNDVVGNGNALISDRLDPGSPLRETMANARK
jgi:hypothetical protein